MAGKGGGGVWKVAYADFVTAMMAFFLVMWITGQNEKVREGVAQYFQDPMRSSRPFHHQDPHAMPVPPMSGEGNQRFSTSDDPQDPLARQPRLLTLHSSGRSVVGAVVVFPEDSAELTQEERARLLRLIPQLTGMPQKIEIRGHATARPLPPGGQFSDAWQLCYARSLATMQVLVEEGIPPQRLRLSQAGSFEPLSILDDPRRQVRNSRVEVYMLNEYAQELVGSREERAHVFQPPQPTSADGASHEEPAAQ